MSAGGFFGTTAARGDTQGHRGPDRSRLVSKATTTSSISGISPSASAVVGEATSASASPVMAMAPQAVAQTVAQTRARPTASTRTQDDDEPQPVPEEPRAAQGPEAGGGQGATRDKEEEEDDQEGTSLTQQVPGHCRERRHWRWWPVAHVCVDVLCNAVGAGCDRGAAGRGAVSPQWGRLTPSTGTQHMGAGAQAGGRSG